MPRLDLPDGNWAELREVSKLSEKARRPAKRAMIRLGELRNEQTPVSGLTPQPVVLNGVPQAPAEPEVRLTREMFDATEEATDLLAVGLIESWSYEPEVSLDALLELPGDAYDVLHTYAQENLGRLFPDFSPNPEPGSPTTA